MRGGGRGGARSGGGRGHRLVRGGGRDDTDRGLSALPAGHEASPPGLAQGAPPQPPPTPLQPPPAYRHSGSCVLSLMEQVPPFRQ